MTSVNWAIISTRILCMGGRFKKLMVAGLVAPNSYTLMHSELPVLS